MSLKDKLWLPPLVIAPIFMGLALWSLFWGYGSVSCMYHFCLLSVFLILVIIGMVIKLALDRANWMKRLVDFIILFCLIVFSVFGYIIMINIMG